MKICYFNAGIFIVVGGILPFISFTDVRWEIITPLFIVCGLMCICIPCIIANKAIMLLSPGEEQQNLAFLNYVKSIKLNKILAILCIALGIVYPCILANRMQEWVVGSVIFFIGGLLMISIPEVATKIFVKTSHSKSLDK